MATIALLPGDGVGPEVTAEAVEVLQAVDRAFGIGLEFEALAIGGDALDRYGVPIREEDIERCRQADAILLGAVGGPKWDCVESLLRPERGLLKIRQSLGLFANLRPVTVFAELVDASPLKPEIVAGSDLLVVRELTGGIYFGQPSRRWQDADGRAAVDTLIYREGEIERVLRLGFELAQARRKRLTSVDKSNVLQSSRLWREIADELRADYPDVALEHVLVDAMAMHLIKSPRRFDVVVTENMFGDIFDRRSLGAGRVDRAAALSESGCRATGFERNATRIVRTDTWQRAGSRWPERCQSDRCNSLGSDVDALVPRQHGGSFGH